MKSNEKYIKILGKTDVTKYLDFIKELDFDNDVFNSLYGRPRFFKNTKASCIIDKPPKWSLQPQKYRRDHITSNSIVEKFKTIAKDDLQLLEDEFGDGQIWRVHFAIMEPNAEIKTHHDPIILRDKSVRIHIPIKTNKNVFFNIDGKEFNFKEGNIILFNNLYNHGVWNHSKYDRIHLIIDKELEKR